jgi:putative flippase GtrA
MKTSTKQKTRKEIATIWRYGLGSTLSYLINLVIIWLMTDIFGVHYLLSSIAGYASIVITSYIFSVTWIFTERKIASRKKEFVAFTLITIFAILMNLVSMWFFTDQLGWHYIISNITTNFLATLWGYIPKKIFLFSEKKRTHYEVEDVLPSLDIPEELPTPFIYEDEIETDNN